MSEAKHTPGPWTAEEPPHRCGLPYVPVVATTMIARVYSTCYGDDAQAAANAQLIAAAPELLAALERVLADVPCDGLDDWEIQARAAIAKAKGV